MKNRSSRLAVLPLAAAALLLPAGGASADVLEAGGTAMAPGDPIQATLSSATMTLSWGNTTISCTGSSGAGSVTGNPGTSSIDDVTGAISGLAFVGTAGPAGSNRCTTNSSTYTTASISAPLPPGGLGMTADAQGGAGPDGSVTIASLSLAVTLFPVSGTSYTCTFSGSPTGGVDNSTSRVMFAGQVLTKTGGPFICGMGTASLNGTYLLMSNGYSLALH